MITLSDLDLLLRAGDIADRESMRTWRSDALEVEIKADGSPVSVTDRLIERLLRELFAEHRPQDRILGEEEGDTGSGPRCWVLDPIDGTASFVAGRRAWGSLIALEVDGLPVAGMVTMPALGRRWWGTLDGGAFMTDDPAATPRPIAVSTESGAEQLRWSSGPTALGPRGARCRRRRCRWAGLLRRSSGRGRPIRRHVRQRQNSVSPSQSGTSAIEASSMTSSSWSSTRSCSQVM